MFTLAELEEDPAAVLDIKEDIRDECSKLGDITNVVLFDKEPEGVASVKFTTTQAAAACVRLMNGRHFSGQKIVAFIADGTQRFQRTRERKGPGEDDDEEEERRLEGFGQWLEEKP
jgi:HIV Tat-specific factor 1